MILAVVVVVVVAVATVAVAVSLVNKRKGSTEMETNIVEANLVCFASITLVLPVLPAMCSLF